MILRLFYILTFLAIPAFALGNGPGKSFHVFNPELPDSIHGIQIQFEVKLVEADRGGSPVKVYCLIADIVNQNNTTECILVRYQCLGEQKSSLIEIGAKQQKIILIDKCLMTLEGAEDLHDYYTLVGLNHGR